MRSSNTAQPRAVLTRSRARRVRAAALAGLVLALSALLASCGGQLGASTSLAHLRRALGPVTIALCAIAVGVAVYAFLRPEAAAFLPAGWHRPVSHGLPVAVMAGLPTFVHALVMSLLTAAVLGFRGEAARGATCAAWCAVEIVFEVAQHPAVGLPLLASLPSGLAETRTFTALASFVRGGTFDPLDIAAAAFGSLTAYAILMRSNGTYANPMEAKHV